MKDSLKKIYRVSLASSIIFLIFGLFLVFQTEGVIRTVSIFMGSLLFIIGIVPIVNYFKNRLANFFSSAGLLYGIFSVVAGLLILFNTKILATIIPILSGVWMIINSVNKIQIAMELRDNNIKSWLITFIFSILILILGVLFIINPFASAVLLGKTIGIFIVIYAILDIVDSVIIKLKAKDVINQIIEIKEEK